VPKTGASAPTGVLASANPKAAEAGELRAAEIVGTTPAPAHQQPRGEDGDDHADGGLGGTLQRIGQVGAEDDDRQPEDEQGRRVSASPREAERSRPCRAVPAIRNDQGRHRREVVGVGRVPQPEQDGDEKRDRDAAHHASCAAATAAWP